MCYSHTVWSHDSSEMFVVIATLKHYHFVAVYAHGAVISDYHGSVVLGWMDERFLGHFFALWRLRRWQKLNFVVNFSMPQVIWTYDPGVKIVSILTNWANQPDLCASRYTIFYSKGIIRHVSQMCTWLSLRTWGNKMFIDISMGSCASHHLPS